MFDIGPEKLLAICVAALVFLGPKELPAAARMLGKWRRQLQTVRETLRDELGSVLELPADIVHPTDDRDPHRNPEP